MNFFRNRLLWTALALLSGLFSMVRADNLTLAPLTLTPGEESELVFSLENNTQYFGFQADISLPEGITPVLNGNGKPTVTLGSRFGSSYMPYSSVVSNGDVRVGTFSANHTAITGYSGELFKVSVMVASDFKGGVVRVGGIKFIDASDNDVNFPPITLSTTVDVPATDDRLHSENFEIACGQTKVVSVFLDNETAYTAFQTDISLSPNLSLVEGSLSLGARASGLSLSSKTVDRVTRITGFSTTNTPVSGNSGVLLTFSVTAGEEPGSGTVTLSNNIFTSTSIQEFRLVDNTAQVTIIEPIPATGIILNPDNVTLFAGTSAPISATVLPENATDKSVTWSSQNEAIAKYEDGRIVALSTGSTVITATCGEVSAYCTVTVTGADDVTVKPGGGSHEDNDDSNPGENTENGGSVKGNDLTLRVGQTAGLLLELPANLTETPQFDWSLATGGDEIVTLTANGSNSASFTGFAIGETTYSVTVAGSSEVIASGKIKVIGQNPVLALNLIPTSLTLAKNALPATITPEFTPETPGITTLTWSSNDESVATVSSDGKVTPQGQGECVITATTTDGTNLSAICQVTVTAPIDDEFELKFDNAAMGGVEGAEILIGEYLDLKPTPKEGYDLPSDISWSSSEDKVASVSDNGRVLGLSVGETIITASATVNGEPVSATCKVTVKPVPAKSITLSAGNLILLVGQSDKLSGTVEPDNTTFKDITWSIDNTTVASIGTDGTVTALATGSATVTATCGDVSATCTVTVKDGGNITVKPGTGTGDGDDEDNENGFIDGTNVTVHVNRSVTMNLELPDDLSVTPTLVWKLANGGEEFVELKPSSDTFSATFTGVSVGKTSYTVTLNGQELIKGNVTVVAEITMKSLELVPDQLSMAKNALPVQLSTVVTPDEATMKEFSWTSSDASVASVSNTGLVSPHNQGQTVITATALDGSGLTAICTVNVTAPIDDEFELKFDNAAMGGVEGAEILIGQYLDLKPTPKEGYDLPSDISWSSSEDKVASVNDNGRVLGLSMGVTTITASATVNGEPVSATCKVTVKPVPLASVTVSAEKTPTLVDGETLQLTAKTEPASATEPIQIKWSSNKPETASVDEKSGLVTAHAVTGTAIITATVSNPAEVEVTGTIEVTVIPTGAGRVILNANDLTLLVGQNDKLTAKVEPETTTDKTINWSSNNDGIASVDNEGNITAVSVGSAIITATCGEVSATCTVTVKDGGNITVKPGDGTGGSGDGDDKDNENGYIDGTNVTVHVNRSVTMNLELPDDLSVTPTLVWTLANGGEEFVELKPSSDTFSATFTGVSVGKTSYTVTLNGQELIKGNVTVVAEVTMKSLELVPDQLSIAKNALPVQLNTVVTPDEATMKEFSWTSSEATVASVSNTGLVSPHNQGQTIITATALDGSGLTAICTVNVTAPIDDNFEFDESVMGGVEGLTIFLGESYTLEPKAHEGYDLPSNITWSSSDEKTVSVDQNGKVTGLALGSATITATAIINGKEISASCTVTVVPIKVSGIKLNRSTLELRATETFTLLPEITPSNATDQSLRWTTNAPSIVSVSQEGLVTALMVGEANITARAQDGSGVSATCVVTVVPTIATGITVEAKGSTTLMATETVQLTATVTPATTTDKTVTWKSDRPAVATVNESGVVTAVSVGEATITATNSAGQSADIKIKVIPTPVESIELNRYTAQLRVQDGFRLTAEVHPPTATDKSVKWSSSDPQAVSVDGEGNVLAVGIGSAIITCAAQDGSGVTAECRVTVNTTATQSISIKAEGSTSIMATKTVQLTANVLPETATDKSVRWQSANTDIATVDSRGLVTGVSVGTVEITATNSGGQSASITITVVPTPVTRITLNRSTVSLKAAETVTLVAGIEPETATVKTLEWSSDNEAVATVNRNGVVTAHSTGSATITVKATDGSGVSATCKVTVTATAVSSIKVTAQGSTTLRASQNVQLTASLLPETATDKSVSWSSSAPAVAGVNENGLVTAYSVGEAVITATASSGLTDQITITVIPTPVTSITLNRTSLTMRVGNQSSLSAEITPPTATDKTVSWSSSNPEVASVDQDGNVTALLEGQASITCTANDGSGVSASCIVNVVDTDVEIITIKAEGPTSLRVSEQVQLTATIMPETSTDKSITWSSADENIASVDAEGLVTALSEGSTVITARTANGLQDQITITVIETQVSSIRLNESLIILQANESFPLIPEIQPSTATNKEIVWSTGDAFVAQISQDGVVTAVAVGETTVTATAADGSGVSASCKVSIIPTPATSISITVLGGTSLEINQTVQLTAEVLPENATDKSVVWTSSNKAVASVTESGLVTALSPGESVITATNSAGQYDRVTITVTGNGPDTPDIPDIPAVSPADTPTQMLRKGDGTSHTFVALMELGDASLEAMGYHYVFGYDGENVIANTPWRYTHTSESVYNDSALDFWVFAYYIDGEGVMHFSSRRHLDGSVDDDFDPAELASASRGGTTEVIIGIYTLEGQYLGTDPDVLDSGIYIVRTNGSSYKIIK